MEIIYIMLPISVFLALLGLAGYFWSVRTGQYDDLDTPPERIFHDDQQE